MKKFAIEIKWGIIFSFAALLWMMFEKRMGWHDELIAKQPIYTNLFGLVAIAIFLFALYDKRKHFYGGRMSWSQGFVSGIVLTVVITLLTPLMQYITNAWITPHYFENVINYTVETGQMERAAAEEYFNLQSYILMSTFSALAMGIVTAAIVALILRKK
ncbi:DUF4199 domain-containing protein [Zunongwangia sp. F363]|uniref:DUF4199 domain-containing protein n=1 Tax=Autumnicola tepida TaxID=3075595 RepID=A0ABU3CDX0_9FLAO|nr:DUF4199 domain-containing protein [Zunongwangia sp. F363]MDT0644412.1 DUF4199 domain-containing protein [Zunongwangia sp. F363]